MKKLISILLAVVIVLSVALSIPIAVSAESLYIRKIVSVVYDDSGSMVGDKWAYANYAMQAFCGMLNSEDRLFLTYMSHSQYYTDYDPEKIDLSASGIQGSVDSIRNHTDSSSTPYEAVEIAKRKLESVNDSNPNTKYWLVVITDGAFDETVAMSDTERRRFLNNDLKDYTSTVMPNGTNPQVTFLGIGDIASPEEDKEKGIYTYSASNAGGIIGAMSEMADRISGRTRLQKSDISKIDGRTIQVSSSIPLLNIAVFVQGVQAKITEAVYGNEINIPVSRNVSLQYPAYSDLVGGAFLLGDSSRAIGSGTYSITFDREIDPENIVVLFEPALETRMTITLNGKEISDYSELDSAMEGDKISVSYKIYEMGTDTEIDPSLMPPGTRFEITVSEDGKVTKQSSGDEMLLSEYVLSNVSTQINAAVIIEGFNPIDYTARFTPTKYVPKVVYTVGADFGGDVRSVKFDNIATNKDLTVCFTVFADGTPMTDAAAVKALSPVITVSPQGNAGDVSYSSDGKIVFTPKAAVMTASGVESFDVSVTCTLGDGTSASEVYTVLIAEYQIVATDATQSVKKTELFGNQVPVSFYITKDGVKLDKAAVEKQILVSLDEKHAKLKTNISVSPDGTITVIPYSEEEHELNFWTWWINWAYYFGLPDEDISVVLEHSLGTASATVDIIGEDIGYILLNVVPPLVIEIIMLVFLLWWVFCIFAKPKFLPGASVYIAYLSHGGQPGNWYHEITSMSEVTLKKYNKLKYRWKPTLRAKVIPIGKNISISAGHGGSIICHKQVWYKGGIIPKQRIHEELDHPQQLMNYVRNHDGLKINVISPYEGDVVQAVESIDRANGETYYIHTNLANISTIGGIETIETGTIFAYAIHQNN